MSSFVVVLDACVLIPAALRDLLLRAALADMCRIQWTEDILEEVRRNLINDIHLPEEKAQRLLFMMRNIFPQAMVTSHTPLIHTMPNDLKDRHVLAAAVACKAQVIVTNNVRHFPDTLLQPLGVESQTPDEFLTGLFDRAPERMINILHEQARDLHNPPVTVLELLNSIAQHAPNFAHLVREWWDYE